MFCYVSQSRSSRIQDPDGCDGDFDTEVKKIDLLI